MSIDRRIVSILYYNDIFDIEEIEKFIGEKNNYFEVVIGGETLKLKIPGKIYPEENNEEIEYIEDIFEIEELIEEDSFEEEMKKSEEENNSFLEKIENEEISEQTEKEVEIVKEKVETKITPVKKPLKLETKIEPVKKTLVPVKKSKNVDSKKNDEDLNDFMNTL